MVFSNDFGIISVAALRLDRLLLRWLLHQRVLTFIEEQPCCSAPDCWVHFDILTLFLNTELRALIAWLSEKLVEFCINNTYSVLGPNIPIPAPSGVFHPSVYYFITWFLRKLTIQCWCAPFWPNLLLSRYLLPQHVLTSVGAEQPCCSPCDS